MTAGYGNTPLHQACADGNMDIVKRYLRGVLEQYPLDQVYTRHAVVCRYSH
jgi:ankyrin repeat protein